MIIKYLLNNKRVRRANDTTFTSFTPKLIVKYREELSWSTLVKDMMIGH